MKNYPVYLSTIAEFKLVKVLEYILQEFGLASREKFLKKFKENIKKISSNPLSCPESELDGIYKNVVTKQTSFYYRILNQEIEIVTITDNRQNPKSIYKELEKLALT